MILTFKRKGRLLLVECEEKWRGEVTIAVDNWQAAGCPTNTEAPTSKRLNYLFGAGIIKNAEGRLDQPYIPIMFKMPLSPEWVHGEIVKRDLQAFKDVLLFTTSKPSKNTLSSLASIIRGMIDDRALIIAPEDPQTSIPSVSTLPIITGEYA